jgi:hypothetical protein
MIYSIVLEFDNIWLSGTLIIIRKPQVWRTDGRTNGRTDMRIVERGNKKNVTLLFVKLIYYFFS